MSARHVRRMAGGPEVTGFTISVDGRPDAVERFLEAFQEVMQELYQEADDLNLADYALLSDPGVAGMAFTLPRYPLPVRGLLTYRYRE